MDRISLDLLSVLVVCNFSWFPPSCIGILMRIIHLYSGDLELVRSSPHPCLFPSLLLYRTSFAQFFSNNSEWSHPLVHSFPPSPSAYASSLVIIVPMVGENRPQRQSPSQNAKSSVTSPRSKSRTNITLHLQDTRNICISTTTPEIGRVWQLFQEGNRIGQCPPAKEARNGP